MSAKTANNLAVCTIDFFCTTHKHLWSGRLCQLLERFPALEGSMRISFYMILYIEQASGAIVLDSKTIRLDQPKVISAKPNSIISININRNASGYLVCFTENFFSLRYNNNVLYQFSFLTKETDSFCRLSGEMALKWSALLQFLQNEYEGHRKNADHMLRSYLNILLCDFDRQLRGGVSHPPSDTKQEKITIFRQLIEKHYREMKKPSEYAKLLFVSPNYLNKICKEETGSTAGDLIRHQIVIESQRLLFHTQSSVNEVAAILGFDSTSYFVTFFRKYTGITPERFRKSTPMYQD